ncbi:peptidoglycan DD-metalloendopeptidase family protein [Streptomyces sp. NPDC049585]|uniref:M23 family metallopeptidase n=1 Tax=Streptomyces sp. NPDC049585 TaxID=3155154 RepID=UPI00342F084E
MRRLHPYAPHRRPRRTRRAARAGRRHLRGAAALCALGILLVPVSAAEPSSAGRPPQRLVRVGSEVLRLAHEAGRVALRYERGVQAAKEERTRAARLAHQLQGQRSAASLLRRDAGATAREQYRTGGFTAAGSPGAAEEPLELIAMQMLEFDRRERLARMLIENDNRSRTLAAGRLSASVTAQALAVDTARLRTEKAALEERLATSRSELNALAEQTVRDGRCTPVDLDGLQEELQSSAQAQDDANRGAGVSRSGWTRPLLSYELSAGFGGTGAHWASGHSGQDFAVPTGTPVRSVGAGTVLSIGCGGPFGISMVVRHQGGWYSQYAHLAAPLLAPGHRVRPGEWIALSGTTGNSTGPHLHFEVRTTADFGSAVDPVPWLRARGVVL